MATTVCRGRAQFPLLASMSARGRALADAQGRCDGAGSEEIGCRPFRHGAAAPEGFSLTLPTAPVFAFTIPVSLVKLPKRRPWAIKREARPAAFAGRPDSRLLVSGDWDTGHAYTAKYPIPPWHWPTASHHCSVRVIVRNPLEKIVRLSPETILAHYSRRLDPFSRGTPTRQSTSP